MGGAFIGKQSSGGMFNPFAVGLGLSASAGQFDNDPEKKAKAVHAFKVGTSNRSMLNPQQKAQVEDIDNKLGLGNNQQKKRSALNPQGQINYSQVGGQVVQKTLLGA